MNTLAIVLLDKCIKRVFIIGMHWKGLYWKNRLERFLQDNCDKEVFIKGLHCKGLCKNILKKF